MLSNVQFQHSPESILGFNNIQRTVLINILFLLHRLADYSGNNCAHFLLYRWKSGSRTSAPSTRRSWSMAADQRVSISTAPAPSPPARPGCPSSGRSPWPTREATCIQTITWTVTDTGIQTTSLTRTRCQGPRWCEWIVVVVVVVVGEAQARCSGLDWTCSPSFLCLKRVTLWTLCGFIFAAKKIVYSRQIPFFCESCLNVILTSGARLQTHSHVDFGVWSVKRSCQRIYCVRESTELPNELQLHGATFYWKFLQIKRCGIGVMTYTFKFRSFIFFSSWNVLTFVQKQVDKWDHLKQLCSQESGLMVLLRDEKTLPCVDKLQYINCTFKARRFVNWAAQLYIIRLWTPDY